MRILVVDGPNLNLVGMREPFRGVNFLHDIAVTSVVGQGPRRYVLGLDAIVAHLRRGAG